MKTIATIVILALAAWSLSSAKLRTSLEVSLERLEDRIVAASGKGEVAIRLHAKRLDELREAAVHSKALRKHYEARLGEMDAAAEAGSTNETRRAEIHLAVERLKVLEVKAKERFDDEKKRHAELKVKIRRLEEQLALLRTISTSADSVDRSSAPTDDEISGAIDSLELEVRRAEAAIEIAIK